MGMFTYDDVRLPLDDRTLTHLQAVIAAKLQWGESFYFSWDDDNDGSHTVWIHPHAHLRFDFDYFIRPDLNHTWLATLTQTIAGRDGLRILTEPTSGATDARDDTLQNQWGTIVD